MNSSNRPSDRELERLFPGDSELAGRMRAPDLGPPEHWPENLRVAVSLCLTSRIPIVMYWGPNFTVLYNDPSISFLGETKHPRYLGQPGRDCWSEIWETHRADAGERPCDREGHMVGGLACLRMPLSQPRSAITRCWL